MPSVRTRTCRHLLAAGTSPGPIPRLVSLTGSAWRCLPCALLFRGCPIVAKATTRQPNVHDAAVLLLSLGEQAAADVLKYLGPKDIHRVGAAMSAVGQVSVTQVTDTLSTFLSAVQVHER